MVNIVKLHFDLTLELDHVFADELGKDIARDLLCEMYNGEDALDWEYKGYKVIL